VKNMAEWTPIGPETVLSDGQVTEVQVEEMRLLVARVEGKYYAAQALCPHLRAHLARGTLEGFIITCPAHGSQFDVRDGSNIAWVAGLPKLAQKAVQLVAKPKDLQTYPTRIQDGQVWVQVV
jgi:nitrite reductase/ring-hydroxylating ferredoxin subunit